MIPVAHNITGITSVFTFHMRCICVVMTLLLFRSQGEVCGGTALQTPVEWTAICSQISPQAPTLGGLAPRNSAWGGSSWCLCLFHTHCALAPSVRVCPRDDPAARAVSFVSRSSNIDVGILVRESGRSDGQHPHLKLLPYVALTLKYRVLKDVLKVAVSVFSTFED